MVDLVTSLKSVDLYQYLCDGVPSLEQFLKDHYDSDFLVSNGPVQADSGESGKPAKLKFETIPGGGRREMARADYRMGSVFYEIPWDRIDWASPLFMNKTVWIGRAPNVTISISQDPVSKLHGGISREDHCAVYTDVESSNGSRINGKVVQPHTQVPIASGDTLELGKIVIFTYFSAAGFHKTLESLK
jgi:hypothetical protein